MMFGDELLGGLTRLLFALGSALMVGAAGAVALWRFAADPKILPLAIGFLGFAVLRLLHEAVMALGAGYALLQLARLASAVCAVLVLIGLRNLADLTAKE